MIIAIDGPAGAGKSTVARKVAEALGLRFLDTGSMYRAVSLEVLRRGADPGDGAACAAIAEGLSLAFDARGRIQIDGRPGEPDVRSSEVTRIVSQVSEHPAVRRAIVARQRALSREWGGLVAEGRDTTSVVFPEADHRFFLTATATERARRRALELGAPERRAEIQTEIERRDRVDSTRACSPLVQAPGVERLDSEGRDADQIARAMLERIGVPSAPEAGAPESSRARSRAAGAAPIVHSTVVYRLGRGLVKLWCQLACRLEVSGAEHLPTHGPCVIAANHQSFLDIPIVASSTPRHVAFAARESLARSRFLAWVMRESGAVLLRRGAADRAAIEGLLAHLAAGDLVAVFPEGTRTVDGGLSEFRAGAVLVARRSGAPLVPATIRGSHRAWPRDALLPRARPVSIRFSAPIDPSHPAALERLRAAIEAELGDGRDRRDRRPPPAHAERAAGPTEPPDASVRDPL